MRTRTRRAAHTLAYEPSESFGEIEGPHYRRTPECPGDVDDVRPWSVLNRDTLHCARPVRRSRRSISTISLLGRVHSLRDPAIRNTRAVHDHALGILQLEQRARRSLEQPEKIAQLDGDLSPVE